MRPATSLATVATAVAVLVLAACARKQPWFERDALQAELTVRGAGLDRRGRLTFARPKPAGQGTLQFDVERDGHLDNATLLVSGATVAFTDGVPRAPSADELRLLSVLAAAFAWPGAEGERAVAGERGAVVTLGAGRFELELGAEVPPPHHAPR